MLFLEDVLKELGDNSDVMVILSSQTVYGHHFEEPSILQDGCGNHHAINWLTAIESCHLWGEFVVKSVEAEKSEYRETPQWKITLENGKDEWTVQLDHASNQAAINRAYYGGR